MFDMSTSESRTPKTGWVITIVANTGMEVGAYLHGFCDDSTKTMRGHDAIWVIIEKLTKSAHFLPIKKTYPLYRLARLYIKETVRLHGVPTSIVSDKDP